MLTATEPGGYSRKFHGRRLNPEIQPLTLLYTNLDRKGTRFVHLQLTNGTPFTYLDRPRPFQILLGNFLATFRILSNFFVGEQLQATFRKTSTFLARFGLF